MRQIYLFSLFLIISICAWTSKAIGQNDLCPLLTKEVNRFVGGKEKRSKEPLFFQLSKNLFGGLQFSNLGLSLTIQMSFDFKDSLGYSEDAGQLLTINFNDGSSQQLIPSSKKTYAGTVHFMLIKPIDKHKKIMTYEDMIFFEKLRNVNITSFHLGVADLPRIIVLSSEQSETIKKIVGCLVE